MIINAITQIRDKTTNARKDQIEFEGFSPKKLVGGKTNRRIKMKIERK